MGVRAFLEIDVPESCAMCPCIMRTMSTDYCYFVDTISLYDQKEFNYVESRAPFCPLIIKESVDG